MNARGATTYQVAPRVFIWPTFALVKRLCAWAVWAVSLWQLAAAQQVLVLRDGSRHTVLVNDISPTSIYYTLPGDTSGLTYVKSLLKVDSLVVGSQAQALLHSYRREPGQHHSVGLISSIDPARLLIGQVAFNLEYPLALGHSLSLGLGYDGLFLPDKYLGLSLRPSYRRYSSRHLVAHGSYWAPYASLAHWAHTNTGAFSEPTVPFRVANTVVGGGVELGRQLLREDKIALNLWVAAGLQLPMGSARADAVNYTAYLGLPSVGPPFCLQAGLRLGFIHLYKKELNP